MKKIGENVIDPLKHWKTGKKPSLLKKLHSVNLLIITIHFFFQS